MPYKPLRELKPELFADEHDRMNALMFDATEGFEDESDLRESEHSSSKAPPSSTDVSQTDSGVVLNVHESVADIEATEVGLINVEVLEGTSEGSPSTGESDMIQSHTIPTGCLHRMNQRTQEKSSSQLGIVNPCFELEGL